MTIFEQVDLWASRVPIDEERAHERKEISREILCRLNSLTKPQGSLGRLEDLVLWYGLACGQSLFPDPGGVVCVFASDHGIAMSGVSAFPQVVTVEMVKNFANGGAAVNVLARQAGLELMVLDMGVNADLSFLPSVVNAKVAYGTQNFLTQRPIVQCIQTGYFKNRKKNQGQNTVHTNMRIFPDPELVFESAGVQGGFPCIGPAIKMKPSGQDRPKNGQENRPDQ